MSGKLRSALVVALVVVGCSAIPSSSFASDSSEAPPPEVLAAMAVEEPTWVNPQAQASCPFCVFAAVAAVRAAQVIRAARAARAVIAAAKTARAASKAAEKVARTTVKRIQTQARTVARRGPGWTKRNWHKLGPKVKACLATAAFMEGYKFLKDGKITQTEWTQYRTFGPTRLAPAEFIAFPIVFTPSQLGSKAAETAIGCAVGAGFAKYFNGPGPTPK